MKLIISIAGIFLSTFFTFKEKGRLKKIYFILLAVCFLLRGISLYDKNILYFYLFLLALSIDIVIFIFIVSKKSDTIGLLVLLIFVIGQYAALLGLPYANELLFFRIVLIIIPVITSIILWSKFTLLVKKSNILIFLLFLIELILKIGSVVN